MGQLLGPRQPLLQLAVDLRARAGARLCRRPRGGAPHRDEPRTRLLASGGELGTRQRDAALMAQAAPQPAVGLWLIVRCSTRMIQRSGRRPGGQARVVRRNNGTQASCSARKPPQADSNLTPNVASVAHSAYWVAGKAALERP